LLDEQSTPSDIGERLVVLHGNANPGLAADICEQLGTRPGNAKVARFPDGEIAVELNEDVRGKDVFVVQSTCPPVNENLMELLVLIDCVKRASAARVTAVIPYFGYARQDRREHGARSTDHREVGCEFNHVLGGWIGWSRWICTVSRSKVSSYIPVDHVYAGKIVR